MRLVVKRSSRSKVEFGFVKEKIFGGGVRYGDLWSLNYSGTEFGFSLALSCGLGFEFEDRSRSRVQCWDDGSYEVWDSSIPPAWDLFDKKGVGVRLVGLVVKRSSRLKVEFGFVKAKIFGGGVRCGDLWCLNCSGSEFGFSWALSYGLDFEFEDRSRSKVQVCGLGWYAWLIRPCHGIQQHLETRTADLNGRVFDALNLHSWKCLA
ncbi:hypothetical protein Droror1_Dr00012196 [Drosera rotundifolia]